MKPFLILQLRPLQDGDYEYEAFLKYGGIPRQAAHRVEMTREHVPKINFDDYSGVMVGGGVLNVSDKKESSEEQRLKKELGQLMKRIIKADFPKFRFFYYA